MLYHRLLAMARSHLTPIAPLVEAATLFSLDLAPHDSLARAWGHEKRLAVARDFALPYQIIAIEDRASVVILADQFPGRRGLAAHRIFVECLPADQLTDHGAFSDPFDEKLLHRDIVARTDPGSVIVTFGTFQSPAQERRQFIVGGQVVQAIAGTPGRLRMNWDDIDPQTPVGLLAYEAAMKAAMTAVEEIVHVEGLPGFGGWPQDDDQVRFGVFDIDAHGSITASDKHTR